MGEFADMALDEVYEMEDLRFAYRMGEIDAYDAYEMGIIDELGYEGSPMCAQNNKVCRHCGAPDLHWIDTAKGWRLAESTGALHKCKTAWERAIQK